MTIGSEGSSPSTPDRFLVLTSRLRDRRRSLGLTQQEVVRRLETLGVMTTNKALSSLEHGAGIDAGKLPEFAAALDCTVTYLLGLTDDPASWQPDRSRGLRPIAAAETRRLAPPKAPKPPAQGPQAQRPESQANGPVRTIKAVPPEAVDVTRPGTTDEHTDEHGDEQADEHADERAAATSWILGPYPER